MATREGTGTDLTSGIWAVALVAFGAFDVTLTAAAVGTGVAAEAHPVVRAGIQQFGLAILPVWKAVLLGGFYLLYRATPRPYDVGVPIGLALVGVAVGVWNVAVVVLSVA
jgi:DNA-binding transcriptional LysR family regulator